MVELMLIDLQMQWEAACNAWSVQAWRANWLYYTSTTPPICSRTSVNGPSEKRTTSLQRTQSVLRIEITIVVILKQPPRSGRFWIPDSGQDPRSLILHFITSK